MAVAAVDNDILSKGACYGLLDELIQAIPATRDTVGVLGAAKYVVAKSLRKKTPNCGVEEVTRRLNVVLAAAEVLEPTAEESVYAAELEAAAQQANHQFDTGESQLCAITVMRGLCSLVTGDKRAIRAVDHIFTARGEQGRLAGKIVCMEQLFLKTLRTVGLGHLRRAVCAEAWVDQAITACFGCHSPEGSEDSCVEGLSSYIADLRRTAPSVLVTVS